MSSFIITCRPKFNLKFKQDLISALPRSEHILITIVCSKVKVTDGNRQSQQNTSTVFAIIGVIQLIGLFIIALLKLVFYILDKRATRYQENLRITQKILVSIPTDCVTNTNSYHSYKLAMYFIIPNPR